MAVELSDIMAHEGEENGKKTYTTPKGQNTSTAIQDALHLANDCKKPVLMKHHHGIEVEINPGLTDKQVLKITGFVMTMERDIQREQEKSSRTTNPPQHQRIARHQSAGFRRL